MLRIVEMVIGVLILVMMALGLMSSLSGGGLNPAYQQVGGLLLRMSPIIGVVCIIIAELLSRTQFRPLAYIVLAIPMVFWAVMLVWLQRETGFFG